MRLLITGVSSGIGLELASQLVASGHEVWGLARRGDKLEALAAALRSDLFRYSVCDVSDPQACDDTRQQMARDNYLPDVVILNAAVDLEDPDPELDYHQSCQMMRTNYDGAYYWITAFIGPFLQRGSGQFLAVGSLLAHWPDTASVSYSASKAALNMMVRGLRLRYSDSALQFKLVHLGPVDTGINPRFTPGEQQGSLIVASAADAARYIAGAIDCGAEDFYFPLYIRMVYTFLGWLPDRPFHFLTAKFKR